MWGVEETHLQLRTVLELNKFFCIRITLLARARWPSFQADHHDFDKSFYNNDYNNNIINKKQKLSINKTKCFRRQTLLYPQGLRGKKFDKKEPPNRKKTNKQKNALVKVGLTRAQSVSPYGFSILANTVE